MSKEELLKILHSETIADTMRWYKWSDGDTVSNKEFIARVDKFRFMLVQNWCLCDYCSMFEPDSKKYHHWSSELKACIYHFKSLKLNYSSDKHTDLTQWLVKNYDYNKPNMVMMIIKSKFKSENITDEKQLRKVCYEFADNINRLIDVITDSRINIDKYITSTFKA